MPARLALVLACLVAAPVSAAEGSGGRAFDVSAGDPLLERDERGLSPFAPHPSRAPAGHAYDAPYALPALRPLGGGWSHAWAAEIGAVASARTGDAAARRTYRDYRDGILVNRLDVAAEHAPSGRYADIALAGPGRDDQHYRLTFGRYGGFRLRARFDEMPRYFTGEARTVFEGAGTGVLTLANGLAAGNETPARIAAALAAAPTFALGFKRRNAGLDFDAAVGEAWRLYARYEQDRKDGTRASGGAMGYPGIPLVELIEPIDYRTHTIETGVQWTGARAHAHASYALSYFRNGIDTLTWEYPFAVNPAVLRRGRLDLYPDNAAHMLKAEGSLALPAGARLAATFGYTRMTQDEALAAPVVNAGRIGGVPPVDLANWNTTAALARSSAQARIDSRLAQITGSFAPHSGLNVNLRLRRQEEDNRTRYEALNPLTGQSGYVGLDGGINDVVPSFLRAPVRAVPHEQRRTQYAIDADYPLMRRTAVSAAFEREAIDARHREQNHTGENRVRLALRNRDIAGATLRFAYEHARRAGEGYGYDPNRLFYAPTALVPAPATLADLRKFDVADRRQDQLSARGHVVVGEATDFALSTRHLANRYAAEYGRRRERTSALNAEWSWTPRPGAAAYAYYGFQRTVSGMASIADDAAGYASGDARAGGAVCPAPNRWQAAFRDDSHLLGFGVRYAFDARTRLESAYTQVYSPYRARYGYASPGALIGGAGAAAAAGDGMPDMVFRRHTLATSLTLALDRTTALRLFHRYDRARYADWHHDGVEPLFAGGAALLLGSGARDHRLHTFGMFIQYTPGRAERAAGSRAPE